MPDQHVNWRRVSHLGDIRAGGEHVWATCYDHGPDGRVGVMLLQSFDELLHQGEGQRIELLGSIQRDDANRSIHARTDKLIRSSACARGRLRFSAHVGQ